MRPQVINSFCGLLDYAAYPIGMLAVAPIVLRKLGTAQYGIWTIAMATVSIGSIIASGFGDANIQQVATARGKGRWDEVVRVVRSTLGIHVVLGCAISVALWWLAAYLAGPLALANPSSKAICLDCIRIAAFLILIRSIESVCISTQRGFERYGAAVAMSVAGRLLGLAAGAVLAWNSSSVAGIMAATAIFAALALVAQLIQLKILLRVRSLRPAFEPVATRRLLHLGVFTWILSATGVVFGQSDRVIGGASVGASAVVAYALCAQIVQPVYGLTAAGLHFLFPYIAFRRVTHSSATVKRTVIRAVLFNWLLVSTVAGLLLMFSKPLLRLLSTDALANACAPILPAVLASAALLALTVSGNYVMVALGKARPVAFINIAAAMAMGLVAVWLLPEKGMWAVISARLAFASIAALVYVPLIRRLRTSEFSSHSQKRSGRPAVRAQRMKPHGYLNDLGLEMSHQLAGESSLQTADRRRPCADVLGVQVDAVAMDEAIAQIELALKSRIKGYICMAGVHGIMEAQRNPAVLKAYADSWMNLPDGMPTVWIGRWQNHPRIERVAGPDLMLEVFRHKQLARFTHFLYGGKPGIAQELAANLSRRFPWARIVGTYTPPFHELTATEEYNLISSLRRLRPSIIWVGISTPRQELFMQRYLPVLETSLIFGVGAAFDYHTGRIKDCADWIKRAGLQWLHRLVQDPRRLFWRYLRNNPSFIWHIGLQLAGLRTSQKSDIRTAEREQAIAHEAPTDLCTPN